MAFTETYLPVARHKHFSFFATGDASAVNEEFNPDFPFILDTIRLALSSVHASAESFVAITSAAQGSVFNFTMVSAAMVGIDSALYFPSRPLYFALSDCIQFSMVMSAANVYGIEVTGWAITQPARTT